MFSKFLLLSVVILCGEISSILSATDKIFCYYGSWSVYRSSAGRLQVSDIDPTLCTHLVYAYAGLDSRGTMIVMDRLNDITNGGLSQFVNLKKKNTNAKIMISLGGWNEGSKKYSDVINNASLRSILVNSISSFLSVYGLDGINIDWQYPTKRGGSAYDYSGFIQFLSDLRSSLGSNKLITASVNGDPSLISSLYNVPQLNNLLDYIHVMTYEFNNAYGGTASQNSPLHPLTSTDKLNTNAAIQAWIGAGASSSKLILGIAAYGRSYTLANANVRNVGAATTGPGAAGALTATPGTLSYLEICKEQLSGGWTLVWDEKQQNPYMYKGTSWIGYDNVASVDLKAKFAASKQLGGVFVWTLDLDDSKNACGGGAFPLLRAVKAAIDASGKDVNPVDECKAYDIQRDKSDCSIYYLCLKSTSGVYQYSKKQCGSGLVFDLERNLCNHPSVVAC